jgi:hypothetical protein
MRRGAMRQARSRARYLRQRLVGEAATWRDNLAGFDDGWSSCC